MSNTRFERFKESMGQFGFEMDSRIEQKSVNNVLGMYAMDLIPKGTILSKFPASMSIPISNELNFPEGALGRCLMLVHSLARELANPDSPYRVYFEYCGTLEEFQDCNVFFNEQDEAMLWRMNPILGDIARRSRIGFNSHLALTLRVDNTLDYKAIVHALIIFHRRCWGRFGFMPGMDLFNHNTKSNQCPEEKIIDGVKCRVIVALSDIPAGEEIKISYGKKDMMHFALSYDFFDPSDFHLISYNQRITQTISDDFVRKIVDNLKAHYKLTWSQENGIERFKIEENNAFFLDHGPNTKMVELASRLAINDDASLSRGMADQTTTAKYLLHILKKFRAANNVENVDINSLPSKLHMFHALLKRELEILDNNIRAISGSKDA